MSRRWLARELCRNDKTLIGFWPLQENLLDYSGLAAHGQSVGGRPGSVYAQQGYMFYRAGRRGVQIGQYTTDLFVDIGSSAYYNFDYTNPFTISVWYYHTGLQNNTSGGLVSRLNEVSSGIMTGYELKISNNSGAHSLTFGLYYQNLHSCAITVPFVGATEKWYHIVATYAGNNSSAGIKIYVNSQIEPPTTTVDNLTFSIANTPGRLQIGDGANNLASATSCGLSLVRIWKRELSAVEIISLYHRELDLYRPRTKVKRPGASNSVPLFIRGPDGTTGSTPLYIRGLGVTNKSMPLSLAGTTGNGGSIPLVITGVGKQVHGLNLFVCSRTIPFNPPGYLPLNLVGTSAGTKGFYKTAPLVISGMAYGKGLNLFVAAAQSDKTVRNMNLFIKGVANQIANWAPLFLQNTQLGSQNSIPLVIIGSGPYPLPPGTPYSKSLNLFIKRWPGAMVPLFVCCSSPAVSSIPMFIQGAGTQTNSMPLVMPNTIGSLDKPSVPLYVSGY
jgi:hypothetical protein